MSMETRVSHQSNTPIPQTGVSILQRQCACGGSPGPSGECARCRSKRQLNSPLQTKLRVNRPGDRFEREADRMADVVMRIPEPGLQREPT